MAGEVKEGREFLAIGEARSAIPQLVEEGVRAALEGLDAAVGGIRKRRADVVHGLLGGLGPEYLAPLAGFDLGELELGVVGVHGANLLPGRGAEDLDDLDELVDAGIAGEQRLAEKELGADAALGPNVNGGGVVGAAKDELGGTVVPRADVRHVGLALDEGLGTAKVAQLELLRVGIDEQILRLDVTVAYAEGVDVRQRSGQLVEVELDVDKGEGNLGLLMMPTYGVHRLLDVLEDKVEIEFVRLFTLE